jgi:hypothetical protein
MTYSFNPSDLTLQGHHITSQEQGTKLCAISSALSAIKQVCPDGLITKENANVLYEKALDTHHLLMGYTDPKGYNYLNPSEPIHKLIQRLLALTCTHLRGNNPATQTAYKGPPPGTFYPNSFC